MRAVGIPLATFFFNAIYLRFVSGGTMRGSFLRFLSNFSILTLTLCLAAGPVANAKAKKGGHGEEVVDFTDVVTPSEATYPPCVPSTIQKSLRGLIKLDEDGGTSIADSILKDFESLAKSSIKGMDKHLANIRKTIEANDIPAPIIIGLLMSPEMGLDRSAAKEPDRIEVLGGKLAKWIEESKKPLDVKEMIEKSSKLVDPSVPADAAVRIDAIFANLKTLVGDAAKAEVKHLFDEFATSKLPLGIPLMLVQAAKGDMHPAALVAAREEWESRGKKQLEVELKKKVAGTDDKFVTAFNNLRLASMTGDLRVDGAVSLIEEFATAKGLAYSLPELLGIDQNGKKAIHPEYCLLNGDSASKKRNALIDALNTRNVDEMGQVAAELNLRPDNIADPKIRKAISKLHNPGSTTDEVLSAAMGLVSSLRQKGAPMAYPEIMGFLGSLKGLKLSPARRSQIEAAYKKTANEAFPSGIDPNTQVETAPRMTTLLGELANPAGDVKNIPAQVKELMTLAKDAGATVPDSIRARLRSGAISMDPVRHREIQKALALATVPATEKELAGLKLETLDGISSFSHWKNKTAEVLKKLSPKQIEALRHLMNNGYFNVAQAEALALMLPSKVLAGKDEPSEEAIKTAIDDVVSNVRPNRLTSSTSNNLPDSVQVGVLEAAASNAPMNFIVKSLGEGVDVPTGARDRFAKLLTHSGVTDVSEEDHGPLAKGITDLRQATKEKDIKAAALALAQLAKSKKIDPKALSRVMEGAGFNRGSKRMKLFDAAVKHAEKEVEETKEDRKPTADQPAPPEVAPTSNKVSKLAIEGMGKCNECHTGNPKAFSGTPEEQLADMVKRLEGRPGGFNKGLTDMLKNADDVGITADQKTALLEHLVALKTGKPPVADPGTPPTAKTAMPVNEALKALEIEIPELANVKSADEFDAMVLLGLKENKPEYRALPDKIWDAITTAKANPTANQDAIASLEYLVNYVTAFSPDRVSKTSRSLFDTKSEGRIMTRYLSKADRGADETAQGRKAFFIKDKEGKWVPMPGPTDEKPARWFTSKTLGIVEKDGGNYWYAYVTQGTPPTSAIRKYYEFSNGQRGFYTTN